MFGILNPTADTQAVIVYPIEPGVLQPIAPEPLDAVVTSTDMETDEVRIWRDSVLADVTSGYSHVFWSDFRAEFGRSYEIQAERADGNRSSVMLYVPVDVAIDLDEAGSRSTLIRFGGDDFRLLHVRLTYGVQYMSDVRGSVCFRRPLYYYTFTYTGRGFRQTEGWDLPLDLGEYVHVLESFFDEDVPSNFSVWQAPFDGLALVSLSLDVTIADETWRLPKGFQDWTAFSHPWMMTNVENGLGFVGAGYRRELSLEPSPEAIRDAGFGYCEEWRG